MEFEEIADLRKRLDAAENKNLSFIAEIKKKDAEILRIKHNTVNLQARVEEEEEFITNNLLKRLEGVKREKEKLAKQVEIEEEFMTNNLQKKLDKLRKEKVELERHLEAEQEYFVNKLQKQLFEVTKQKNALERKLNEGRSGLISKLEKSVGDYKRDLQPQLCPQEREGALVLERQIQQMRETQHGVEAEAHEYREKCESLMEQIKELTAEKFGLQAKTNHYREQLEKLRLQREEEFSQFERSQEWQFNFFIRRPGSSPHRDLSQSARPSSCPRLYNKAAIRSRSDGSMRSRRFSSPICTTSNGGQSRAPMLTPDSIARHTEAVLSMSPGLQPLSAATRHPSPLQRL